MVLAPLPKRKDSIKKEEKDREVENLLNRFLDEKSAKKDEKVEKKAHLRESIFTDEYWSGLRRTRIYRTTKFI